MHRTAYITGYILLSVLVLLGSGVGAAADDCATPGVYGTCDDGLFCNGPDTCAWKDVGGIQEWGCYSHGTNPCLGKPTCANFCNETTDDCFRPEGTPCESDSNDCTDDECDGAGACDHVFNDDPCDDNIFCNGADRCVGGECSQHAGDPCAGNPECANLCTEDSGGHCFAPSGTVCTDDGNECTDDQCDGAGSCVHPKNSNACDDGLFCTAIDTCLLGKCIGIGNPCEGEPVCANTCNEDTDDCLTTKGTACTDDGNVCTDNECDGLGDCTLVPNYAQCDDGLFCNGTDTCSGGTCSLHTGDPCAAASECTLACDEGTDVCAIPLGTPCSSDGNPCTNDVCLNGECTHSTVPGCQVCLTDGDCDDSNLCTLDKCGDRGCEHAALPGCGACSTDGDCDDKNLCTTDKCSNQVCEHTPIAGCAFCTVDDNCNDADPCTLDTCGVNGCENTPIPDCVPCTVDGDCDDGDACTLDACGPENQCNQSDATCFTAVGCAFFNGLEMDACAGERIPPAIAKLVARAGCKVEQAETHTRGGLRRVKKKLTLAQRSLAKAMNRLKKARGKKLSIPCADALSAEVGDRSTRIMALADKGNGGSQLAACTEALATGEVASLQTLGPSLCGKR